MTKHLLAALCLGVAIIPGSALAQAAPLGGTTRVNLVGEGKVSRVPDLAIISAGVVTRATSATQAIADNAARMERVRAALKREGVADRDLRTSSVNLDPQYRYEQNQAPELTGYNASNMLTIRFRDIRKAGAILDVLVREGANQINGPTLTIDHPETAEAEARMAALADGRAKAEAYARGLGKRVARLVSVSEGGAVVAPPMPMFERSDSMVVTASRVSKTEIVPGEQDVGVNLSMSFDLE